MDSSYVVSGGLKLPLLASASPMSVLTAGTDSKVDPCTLPLGYGTIETVVLKKLEFPWGSRTG